MEAFHLHSKDGKNTNSHKVSELKSPQRKQILLLSCIACIEKKRLQKHSDKNSWFSYFFICLHYAHSFLQGWNPPPPFLREPPSFWSKLKMLPPSFWQPSKLLHVNCIKHFKMKVLRFVLYKSIENIIIITHYAFRLNSVFTADTCFG